MTGPPALRLATRGSPLARWQAGRVAALLAARGTAAELVVVETAGDRHLDVPLDQLGGQGVFVKEVQAAVVEGRADAAVHSAKDLPAAPELAVPGLVLAAVPARGDPRDLLVGATLEGLDPGATVATGSARRRAQLANLRPDLTFVGLRGNLARRLAVAGTGGVAAVVVAQAAVDRLGWRAPDGVATEALGPSTMLPQVGQGAIAVECRADDRRTLAAVSEVDDPAAAPMVAAERAFLATLGGGCSLPVGALARPDPSSPAAVVVTGLVASPDGVVVLRHAERGADPVVTGCAVARYLLDEAGGADLGPWPAPPLDAAHPSGAR